MSTFKPSIVGLSCILCARMVSKICPLWNPYYKEMTNLEFVQDGIKTCFERIYSMYDENFKPQPDYTPTN